PALVRSLLPAPQAESAVPHPVTDTVTATVTDTPPVPPRTRQTRAQRRAVTDTVTDTVPVTDAPEVPAFDPVKYRLGKLCPRGHEYHSTGQSLRKNSNAACLACDAQQARARRQARRQQEVSP